MDNAEALKALETIEQAMWRAELDSWEEEFSVIRQALTAPRVPDSTVTEALAQALRECITHFVMIDREESATVKCAEKALAMLTAAPAPADATKENDND